MLPVVPTPRDPPVLPGQVWRRACCTAHFARTVVVATCFTALLHVLVGWAQYTCYLTCAMPTERAADACLVLPGQTASRRGVALITEVLGDAFFCAWGVAGALLPRRRRDVRQGRLPLIAADAFPRGCLLKCAFPRIDPRGRPIEPNDHPQNLKSWHAVAFSWAVGWGGMTLSLLALLWALPGAGGPRGSFCISPWAYIGVRAAWSGLESLLVASGCYVLWGTLGCEAQAASQQQRLLHAVLGDDLILRPQPQQHDGGENGGGGAALPYAAPLHASLNASTKTLPSTAPATN